ncbi:phage Gp37/Gp68 family protein [Methylobacterium indicum]|uniref:Phage protein Gp37/Gp68 n=1 Tax=Methylobacterium indicum TaxID=1775910 RepID=A0ABR5HEQ2_9HYPH|nr:phage Gp37/Gp68 family protein [Methylobacterium indicum]KMO18874.1 hypothetical protein QR78_14235 [Methylobacterium indicum]KMO25032.1 hypothetical protein QR79_09625 [Methylobacterium indicum]
MAETTTIEWTEATWQIVTGCSIASPGCTNCYAMRLAGSRLQHHPSRAGLTRGTKSGPVWTGEVRFNREWLTQPLKWKRPRKVFVAAHGDLFHEGVPDDVLDQVFAVMALAPQHTFQVLTKRADRMRAYMTDPGAPRRIHALVCDMAILFALDVVLIADPAMERHAPPGPRVMLGAWPLANVWLGVSVEDQRRADERIPDLLATPAAVRWISAEPLLGPIDLTQVDGAGAEERGFSLHALTGHPARAIPGLSWIVVGGESGPGARPMHPDWARSLRDQCAAAGVPYLFKQQGAWAEVAEHPRGRFVSSEPDVEAIQSQGPAFMAPVGKKAAGRLLDGVEHNGFPGGAG